MALTKSVSVAPAVELGMVYSLSRNVAWSSHSVPSLLPSHSFEWSIFSFRRTRVLPWTFVSLAAQ